MTPSWKTLASWVVILAAFCGIAQAEPLRILTTTTMIADMTKNIGGDFVAVESLMGAGVDPHMYKPTAWDATKIREAEIIFYNGLHLEGKMVALFESMIAQGKKAYAVTQNLEKADIIFSDTNQIHADPHFWFDPHLWTKAIDAVLNTLIQEKPESAPYFKENAAAYKQRIQDAHEWILFRLSQIPKDQRILITSHDAFNYFGRAYTFEVIGVQGISTVTEAGLADVVSVVDLIKEKKIKSIFVETSVSPALIARISKDAGATIGGALFSDSLGNVGQVTQVDLDETLMLDTYVGMIKANANIIAEGLKPE